MKFELHSFMGERTVSPCRCVIPIAKTKEKQPVENDFMASLYNLRENMYCNLNLLPPLNNDIGFSYGSFESFCIIEYSSKTVL